ncbi:MAG: family 43 glycosylhydrolase [Polyangia bacterium]
MKPKSSLVCLALVLVLSPAGFIAPAATAATYSNPVLDQDGDPYVLKSSDGKFYLYQPHEQRVYCHSSKDLVHWAPAGPRTDGEIYNNIGHDDPKDPKHKVKALWAPEVHEVNGKYYMYYVSSMTGGADPDHTGNKDILVVEGTSPTQFDPDTRKVLLDGDYAFLDPTFFKDADGKMFLFFKWRGHSGTGSEIKGRRLADPKNFWDSTGGTVLLNSDQLVDKFGPGQMEHPSVDEKNGHYVLFFSYGDGNGTGDDAYKVFYAKATNPLGPYTLAAENPILYSGQSPGVRTPGATSTVRDGDNKLWMVYRQKKDRSAKRDLVVCIDRCVITDAGNVNITATHGTTETAPVPLP